MSFIKNKKAFTLIEILISITILGIVAISFSFVFATANIKINSALEQSNINAAVVSHIKTFGDTTGNNSTALAEFYNVFTEVSTKNAVDISFEVQVGTTQHIITSSGELLIAKEQPTKLGTPENDRFFYFKPNRTLSQTSQPNVGTPTVIPPWLPITP